MSESATLPRGQVPKTRWTVLGEAPPKSDGRCMRRRVRVRCVCGRERSAFERDLRDGRSTGCESHRCREVWRVAEHMRARGGVRSMAEFEREVAALLKSSRSLFSEVGGE